MVAQILAKMCFHRKWETSAYYKIITYNQNFGPFVQNHDKKRSITIIKKKGENYTNESANTRLSSCPKHVRLLGTGTHYSKHPTLASQQNPRMVKGPSGTRKYWCYCFEDHDRWQNAKSWLAAPRPIS